MKYIVTYVDEKANEREYVLFHWDAAMLMIEGLHEEQRSFKLVCKKA